VGFSGEVLGKGPMVVTPLTDDPNFSAAQKIIDLGDGSKVTNISEGIKIRATRVTLEFSNNAVAGNWFELHEIAEWYRAIASSPK
jgi:hypothetical protein